MHIGNVDQGSKKRSVNITVREDILNRARALSLNTSRAAEAGILEAIKVKQQEQWLKENRSAIAAHNVRVESEGMLLQPHWDDT